MKTSNGISLKDAVECACLIDKVIDYLQRNPVKTIGTFEPVLWDLGTDGYRLFSWDGKNWRDSQGNSLGS